MRTPPDLQRPQWLEWLHRHIWVLAFIVGALTFTALRCSGRLRHVPDPPEVMFALPADYTLVDQEGRPFDPQTLRGKVWVAGFVFTTCPSSCPAVGCWWRSAMAGRWRSMTHWAPSYGGSRDPRATSSVPSGSGRCTVLESAIPADTRSR